jgi:hypothetical protein
MLARVYAALAQALRPFFEQCRTERRCACMLAHSNDGQDHAQPQSRRSDEPRLRTARLNETQRYWPYEHLTRRQRAGGGGTIGRRAGLLELVEERLAAYRPHG